MRTKKMKKEDAFAFVQNLVMIYFKQRNLEALSDYMEPYTSWIGTGEGETSHNIEEAQAALTEELSEYCGGFEITQSSLEFLPFLDNGGIVYGTLSAVPADHSLSNEDMRLSMVLEQDAQGIKLVHMHFSHADPAQEQGQYFVKQNMRGDNQSLRQELNIRNLQLANLTQNIPGGAHQCANDESFTLLSMSNGFLSMFGYTKEEVETQFEGKFLHMIYPGDRSEVRRIIREQLQHGSDIEIEYRVQCKEGQPVWVLDKGRLIDNGDGSHCFYCLLVDVTERKREQEELRLSLERHQVIMNQAADIIFEWDIQRDTLEFSTNFKKKFGYQAVGRKISGTIPLSQNIHKEDMPAFIKIMKDTAAGVPYSETEFRICDNRGTYYWCRIRATTQYNADGLPIKAVGVIVDINEEKKQKEALIAQAQQDTLTGIYNKAAINTLVAQRMQSRPNKEGADFQALLIIDVDYFKAVNDTYGHLCGDVVLSDVAAALKGSTRSGDLVGRIGGDEFLVYLSEIADEEVVLQKAQQLLEAVGKIYPKVGKPPISCSIGAAVLPYGELEYQTFYKYADRALYQQKSNRRGGVTLWNRETPGEEPSDGQLLSSVGNSIVSDEGNVDDEWLAQYAFRTLYSSTDIASTVDHLLEILGRSFDVSRVYIFESSEDGTRCSNTFEWCGEGVPTQIAVLQNIAYRDELGDYLTNFNERGIFYCHDIEHLHPDVLGILKPQGIRSMLQCAMLDEGKIVGYVGFDECRENRSWSERQIASFKLTADVLSTFLMKLREKQKK